MVSGARQPPMTFVTREFLDAAWPSEIGTGVPTYWTLVGQTDILVGQAPDMAYGYELTGSQRFIQLSLTNPTNFISINMPELYLAAAMVFMTGHQRDWGAQADDPKMAMSWENNYQTLKAGTSSEEMRKIFRGVNNTTDLPSPLSPP